MADVVSLPTIPWQALRLDNRLEKAQQFLKSSKEDPSSRKNEAQLREACSELESLFIHYLFKEMRATVPKSGFLSGGKAEEIYTSMLDVQLAKELSTKGGIGLASVFLDQLGREAASGKSKTSKESD